MQYTHRQKANQPAKQPANQHASKPTRRQTSQPANTQASQQASKQASQSASQQASQIGNGRIGARLEPDWCMPIWHKFCQEPFVWPATIVGPKSGNIWEINFLFMGNFLSMEGGRSRS